jgi:peptide-methionine (S)-S-oxide reductase
MEKAYFAAGCFWGVEDIFMKTEGVIKTAVGYMNGLEANPNYKSVCAGNTGHAEAVELEFDEHLIDYQQLLKIFFDLHNPTTKNQQGPDIGSQYRSGIFTVNEKQLEISKQYIQRLKEEKIFEKPIVTIVEPAQEFFLAENYHQQYFKKKNGGSCKF